MISEDDRRAIRAADREIDREISAERAKSEEKRKKKSSTVRSWRERNPEKIAAYAAKYRNTHREDIKRASKARYRAASVAAVPNKALAEWRHRLGLKQKAAAKLLGISQAYYSNFETGIYPPPGWVMERIQQDMRKMGSNETV